ncbi:MAG: TRAP transporter large permease subunit [Pseudomonadota bacterium]
MDGNLLPILMGLFLFIGIFSGYPVAFVLGGLGVVFLFIGDLPIFNLQLAVSRIIGIMSNWLLLAIPLFVFMGLMLDRSGIAANLLYSLERLLGNVRGGLAVAVAFLGIVLAASTGIVGASVVMLGVLALPVMLRERYAPQLATGVVAASGTLGILIPPSIMLVVLGSMLQVSVGDLFKAAFVPGLLLGGLYVAYVFILARIKPSWAPAVERANRSEGWRAVWEVLRDLAGPVALIVMVLGSIIAGIATPTEAAALGAFGAMVLAFLSGKLTWPALKSVIYETGSVTAMILFVLIGATVFSGVFKALGGNDMIADAVSGTGLGPYGIMVMFMVVLFILGCFLEWIEITFVVLPLFTPIVMALDFGLGFTPTEQLVWFAIAVAVNLQTSFMTPPFGFSLFYVKGVSPPDIQIGTIYKGALPFVALQLIGLSSVLIFPALTIGVVRFFG